MRKRSMHFFGIAGIFVLGIYLTGVQQIQAQLIHIIPAPEGKSYFGAPIIYKNKLYLRYIERGHGVTLGEYYRIHLSFIPNPPAGTIYMGNPIVYQKSKNPFLCPHPLVFWRMDR